jgi:hypothetical protein
MIKTFKHKDVSIKIKTNFLKDFKCYFGEKDIGVEILEAYNETKFKKNHSTEEFIINIFNYLKRKGIKVESISKDEFEFQGQKMMRFEDKQKEGE